MIRRCSPGVAQKSIPDLKSDMLRRLLLVFLAVGACAPSLSAQEFEVDIVPLLRRECIACHGPALQMSGLRLDRRDDAMLVIEPGDSSESLMIQRLVDDSLGVRMPPKFGDGSSMPQRDIGPDQWISATATGWACIALLHTLR